MMNEAVINIINFLLPNLDSLLQKVNNNSSISLSQEGKENFFNEFLSILNISKKPLTIDNLFSSKAVNNYQTKDLKDKKQDCCTLEEFVKKNAFFNISSYEPNKMKEISFKDSGSEIILPEKYTKDTIASNKYIKTGFLRDYIFDSISCKNENPDKGLIKKKDFLSKIVKQDKALSYTYETKTKDIKENHHNNNLYNLKATFDTQLETKKNEIFKIDSLYTSNKQPLTLHCKNNANKEIFYLPDNQGDIRLEENYILPQLLQNNKINDKKRITAAFILDKQDVENREIKVLIKSIKTIEKKREHFRDFSQILMSHKTENNIKFKHIQSSIDPKEVIHHIADKIKVSFKHHINSIKIQLFPPELGKLKVEIVMKDNHLKASLIADNFLAKQIIEAHLDQLKTSLQQHSIFVDDFTVTVTSDSRSFTTFSHNNSGGFSDSRDNPLNSFCSFQEKFQDKGSKTIPNPHRSLGWIDIII